LFLIKGLLGSLITFRILQASGRTIRSFNADSDVNDIINEAGIKKGGLSDWINDKIKKGLIYDKTPAKENPKDIKIVEKVRLRY